MHRHAASDLYSSSKYDWCWLSRNSSKGAVGDAAAAMALLPDEKDGCTMTGKDSTNLGDLLYERVSLGYLDMVVRVKDKIERV